MTRHSPPVRDEEQVGKPSTLPDWAVGVFTIEMISVLIGLAMPITPSKTGSTWRPSTLFWTEPNYLKDAAIYFVATNVLLVTMLALAWVVHKLGK